MDKIVKREELGSDRYAFYGYEETKTSTLALITYRGLDGMSVLVVEYDPIGKLSQKEKEAVWTNKSSTTTKEA